MGGECCGSCIRLMTEADLQEIAGLEEQIFADAWSLPLWRQSLAQRTFCGLVLTLPEEERRKPEGGHTLAGYVCGQFILDEGEIHRIAVTASLRERGLGQILLESFLQLGVEKGIARFFLEVRAGNRPARALYEKNGFVTIGTRRNYYQDPREDAIILEKNLCR